MVQPIAYIVRPDSEFDLYLAQAVARLGSSAAARQAARAAYDVVHANGPSGPADQQSRPVLPLFLCGCFHSMPGYGPARGYGRVTTFFRVTVDEPPLAVLAAEDFGHADAHRYQLVLTGEMDRGVLKTGPRSPLASCCRTCRFVSPPGENEATSVR
jgi:hypothetical protein